MKKHTTYVRRILKSAGIYLTALVLLAATVVFPMSPKAAETYPISADLSCYVNAMGGVEFGHPLLTNTEFSVDDNGGEQLTMYFTKSSVTIYSVTCDTFIDPDPSYKTNDRGVMSGTIGYYDAGGDLITSGVSYTLSDDTALNATDDAVHYVDSITFPIDSRRDTYSLTLYINSNVMGVQFTNPNSQATATTYPATLTVDWSSLAYEGEAEQAAQNEDTAQEDNAADITAPTSADQITEAAESTDTQTTTEASTQAAASTAETVTQMDGLSIHIAGSDETKATDVSTPDTVIAKRAYLNIPALTIIACIGAAIFIAGLIVTLLSVKKSKNKKDDTVENIEK